jgi:transposase
LTEAERETLEGFLHANPRLAQGDDLTTRFQTFLAQRDVGALEAWLQEAEPLDLPSFQTVARSFRQNDAAITAALTALWSTGQYEGQICRVKLRKRLGYGHATLDLLGQRILRRVTTPGASVQRALP